MSGHTIRRTLAVLAAATLAATLAGTALAAEVEAAKPKPRCQGKVATIVGTQKADIIRGTARRDIIVAKGGTDRIYGKGGNDIICAGGGNDVVYGGTGADRLWGQLGHDRLLGNAGPDFLAGQVGNDIINGGIGVDTCFQGTGTGPVTRCERPAVPVPAPVPAPAPPPPKPPELIPLTGILAVAYSDIDGLDGYSTEDVLIAKLVDTDGDKVPSAGDSIEMGRYPTNLDASAFGDWGVTSHSVTIGANFATTNVEAFIGGDRDITWINDPRAEYFWEADHIPDLKDAVFLDRLDGSGGGPDYIRVSSGSPSLPQTVVPFTDDADSGDTDDPFLEVELNFEVP